MFNDDVYKLNYLIKIFYSKNLQVESSLLDF